MILSVVVTTHNRSHLLPDCLQSILNNHLPKQNILVVDDSDHGFHQYINQLTCRSFDISYKFIPFSGLASSRNFAFSFFATQFVTFLDDDDRWPEHYIDSILDLLTPSAKIILSYPSICLNNIPFERYPNGFHLYDLFFCGITPPVGLQIYSKDVLNDISPYNDSIRSGVDHDLWINLLCKNPYVTINTLAINILSVSTGDSLTSDFPKRYRDINCSLTFWAPIITSFLGHSFLKHFCQSYNSSLDDLLYRSLLKGNLGNLSYFKLHRFLLWIGRRFFNIYKSSQMFPSFTK